MPLEDKIVLDVVRPCAHPVYKTWVGNALLKTRSKRVEQRNVQKLQIVSFYIMLANLNVRNVKMAEEH